MIKMPHEQSERFDKRIQGIVKINIYFFIEPRSADKEGVSAVLQACLGKRESALVELEGWSTRVWEMTKGILKYAIESKIRNSWGTTLYVGEDKENVDGSTLCTL